MSGTGGKKKVAAIDNTARRTWDKEEYREKAEEREAKEKKETVGGVGAGWRMGHGSHAWRSRMHGAAHGSTHARTLAPHPPQEGQDDDKEDKWAARKRRRVERDPLHQGQIVARSELKSRDFQIDLASRLNKTQVRTALLMALHCHPRPMHACAWSLPCCPVAAASTACNGCMATSTCVCRLARAETRLLTTQRVGHCMQVVGANAALNQQGGYFCNVCDCVLKDSITYLDHINGKRAPPCPACTHACHGMPMHAPTPPSHPHPTFYPMRTQASGTTAHSA
jgi:hypothetical protein